MWKRAFLCTSGSAYLFKETIYNADQCVLMASDAQTYELLKKVLDKEV